MTEPEASEATIHLIYRSYYGEMGGAGAPPDVKAHMTASETARKPLRKRHGLPPDNSPPQRPAPKPPKAAGGQPAKPRLPGGADLYLPHHRLCQHPLFLALRRFVRRSTAANSP